ncbi:MAG: hypothetical protein ABSB99_02540 [Acidimicrobiales bacterium]
MLGGGGGPGGTAPGGGEPGAVPGGGAKPAGTAPGGWVEPGGADGGGGKPGGCDQDDSQLADPAGTAASAEASPNTGWAGTSALGRGGIPGPGVAGSLVEVSDAGAAVSELESSELGGTRWAEAGSSAGFVSVGSFMSRMSRSPR